ncbi:sugar phosphate isomerase/epimerase [bacterium]|nr:sugar phosphate isomerase/epimerase [bacterium]
MDRRQFLSASAAGVVLAQASTVRAFDKRINHKLCAFTKPFNSLSFDELAKQMAELGFDGIEAPIRKGGHVEPDQVEDRLPELVEALTRHNLELTVMTSDVNDPRDPLTERVLKTAAGLGVKRYRMKYFKYDLAKPIRQQIEQWKPQVNELAAMNKQLGITGLYQNHSGKNYVGATLWDLPRLLDGVDRNQLAVAYDIRHATVEGGTSWPTTLKMISPHVSTVYVKDFQWGDAAKPKNVPLGQGRVDGREFVKMLRQMNYSGPISLHEEYLDHKQPKLVPDHLMALKKDIATLKTWLTS